VPSASRTAVGYICGHRLTFDKRSIDGSGKCDAQATSDSKDKVYGVVYEIDPVEKATLDRVEGLGHGYAEKVVEVNCGTTIRPVCMYYATSKDLSLRPYHWYKAYVLAGARENSLPLEYIKMIERFPSVQDPDARRSKMHRL
jgi:hypothetical protein